MTISLKAGWNAVVYTGKAQTMGDAFASIMPYVEIVYYYDNLTKLYEQVITTTTMIPYGVYWIDVTQDCTWTYGAEATPPTSVQLYEGWNYVAYTGPAQSWEAAFASIAAYLTIYYYYNNITKAYEFTPIMIPNGAYFVKVTRNCLWTFVAPEVVPCDITITAPDSAAEGEKVSVSALLKNVSSYGYMYKTEISAVPDLFPAFRIGTIEKYIDSGASFTAYGSFTMPASNTTILIWVERWAVDHWVYDNSASKVVSLEIPVPEYKGTISKKQLEYDEARASIPAYDIPEGQRGLVHIWGRNDMATSQRMGIYWFVADPDGMIAEEYGPAWEAWPYTGAGKEHEFIGGRFNLDREKYTMWVELLMNPDNPEVVDRYIGDLCTVVAAVPEPEFRGFAVAEYVKR